MSWGDGDLGMWILARRNIYPAEPEDFGLHIEPSIKKMMTLVGMDTSRHLQDNDLTDEQRVLLRMLAGPHGKIIAKAIEIKRSATNELATETGVSSYDQAKAEQA